MSSLPSSLLSNTFHGLLSWNNTDDDHSLYISLSSRLSSPSSLLPSSSLPSSLNQFRPTAAIDFDDDPNTIIEFTIVHHGCALYLYLVPILYYDIQYSIEYNDELLLLYNAQRSIGYKDVNTTVCDNNNIQRSIKYNDDDNNFGFDRDLVHDQPSFILWKNPCELLLRLPIQHILRKDKKKNQVLLRPTTDPLLLLLRVRMRKKFVPSTFEVKKNPHHRPTNEVENHHHHQRVLLLLATMLLRTFCVLVLRLHHRPNTSIDLLRDILLFA